MGQQIFNEKEQKLDILRPFTIQKHFCAQTHFEFPPFLSLSLAQLAIFVALKQKLLWPQMEEASWPHLQGRAISIARVLLLARSKSGAVRQAEKVLLASGAKRKKGRREGTKKRSQIKCVRACSANVRTWPPGTWSLAPADSQPRNKSQQGPHNKSLAQNKLSHGLLAAIIARQSPPPPPPPPPQSTVGSRRVLFVGRRATC